MAFESPSSEAVYFQILTLVDGIEDEDWDVQYVLHEITRILELGWNVNDKYRTPTNGGSVLLLVLPYPGLTHLLLEHGYDPNETFPSGSTPLTLAVVSNWPPQVLDLLIHGASPTASRPLHIAAVRNNFELMALLLEHGVPIDRVAQAVLPRGSSRESQPYYCTALHDVASKGLLQSVHFLLERGADPTVLDSSGATPASRVPDNYPECRELLLAAADRWQVK